MIQLEQNSFMKNSINVTFNTTSYDEALLGCEIVYPVNGTHYTQSGL